MKDTCVHPFNLRDLRSKFTGGFAGSLFDSLLGATVQAIYYSDGQQKERERPIDTDGQPTRHLRGWRWLSNNWVNVLASTVGGCVSMVLWLLF